ncbi:MAG: hypothetical protein OEY59_04095 [Deltaproteobacteria bacterium]|nr:hypothetical protein [Deltaproteobacteria bacterium]
MSSEKIKSSANPKIRDFVAHDEIMLSRIVSEKQTIQISFLDGEFIIDQLKWHTTDFLGLKGGKVVNKKAVKYWEVIDKK